MADEDVRETHYWLYSPGEGACKWEAFCKRGVMGLGWSEIGDLTQFSSQDEMRDAMKSAIDQTKSHDSGARATWQFLKEMKVGDVIFAKRGRHTLIGRGVVTSRYIYDPSSDAEYPHIREVDWTSKKECKYPGLAAMRILCIQIGRAHV